jgi:hypothetical protein
MCWHHPKLKSDMLDLVDEQRIVVDGASDGFRQVLDDVLQFTKCCCLISIGYLN